MLPLKDDNPISIFPFMTISIIILNIVVFYLQLTTREITPERIVFTYGLIPYELINHSVSFSYSYLHISPYIKLFTSMFMHGSMMHIIGNMLYLWIFGNNIEDFLGHGRFILFYLICGISAGLIHTFFNPYSRVPMIGASGAVSGVLGAYLLIYPRAKVWTLIFFGFFMKVVKIPALIVLGFWIILQIVNGYLSSVSNSSAGVAWFAHIGGFITGFIIIYLMKRDVNRYRRP